MKSLWNHCPGRHDAAWWKTNSVHRIGYEKVRFESHVMHPAGKCDESSRKSQSAGPTKSYAKQQKGMSLATAQSPQLFTLLVAQDHHEIKGSRMPGRYKSHLNAWLLLQFTQKSELALSLSLSLSLSLRIELCPSSLAKRDSFFRVPPEPATGLFQCSKMLTYANKRHTAQAYLQTGTLCWNTICITATVTLICWLQLANIRGIRRYGHLINGSITLQYQNRINISLEDIWRYDMKHELNHKINPPSVIALSSTFGSKSWSTFPRCSWMLCHPRALSLKVEVLAFSIFLKRCASPACRDIKHLETPLCHAHVCVTVSLITTRTKQLKVVE